MATALERENLEAHVDLCEQRYKNLEGRLDKIEAKVHHIHDDITRGQQSMTKVIIGSAGTEKKAMKSYLKMIFRKRTRRRSPT